MAKLAGDRPRAQVIFENAASGTSTSKGLKELGPGEGVEMWMCEPYSAGFTDASPLINKVKASGANALFSVSYLNDLILIVRTGKQVGLNIAINGGSGGFVIPEFYKNVGKLAEGLQGVAHWNHDMADNAQEVNAGYKKRTGDFLFEYARGLVAQTYTIVSIGVTLICGVVKIVNFAQGEFVMIGMYISFYLATQFGIDPILSLVVSMPVLFVAGVLIQHFLIRRVLGPNDMPQIFLTFALSLLLLNLALMLFSANYRTVHTSYSDEAFHIGGLYIPGGKLIAFVVAMFLSGALWVFLHTTDLGKAMRAAAQNRDVATLMGINPNRVFCVALGIALALAGAAGSLLMPFYSAYPFVGQVFVLMAFVAVVLGTLGNVIGALVASLMMGVAESLGIQYVGADSGLIVVFAMLLF